MDIEKVKRELDKLDLKELSPIEVQSVGKVIYSIGESLLNEEIYQRSLMDTTAPKQKH